MLQNFRFLAICSILIALLFSCSDNFGELDSDVKISKRDIFEGVSVGKDSCKAAMDSTSAYHTQLLNLDGLNLKRGTNESVDSFLLRLGYDTSVLCEKDCESSGGTCTVTNVSNHSTSDLKSKPGNGGSFALIALYARLAGQDMTSVNVILKPVCKCK